MPMTLTGSNKVYRITLNYSVNFVKSEHNALALVKMNEIITEINLDK